MLPIGVSARPPGRPHVTAMLVVVLVAVWVRVQLLRDAPLAPYCTDLTESAESVRRAAGTVQAFVCQWGLVPDEVAKGAQLHSLVSATFVHVGWFHLLSNLAFLVAFAPRVEADLGPGRFLGLFVGGGAAGALAHVALVEDTLRSVAPTLGASGAVAAVMGAHVVLAPGASVRTLVLVVPVRLPSRYVVALWAAVQVWATARVLGSSDEVVAASFEAHVSGLALGLGVTALALWRRPGIRGWPADRHAASRPPTCAREGQDRGQA